jgi:Zn-finger nucleic acid-binding protein
MLCPNDGAAMRPVSINSHYGQPMTVDQCEKCGGIWFDESELFRAGRGEAEKIEALNTEAFITPSQAENLVLACPRDQVQLFRFTDKHFPESIILERCPTCHGIWLNRGDFSRYQKARWESLQPKEKAAENKKLQETIEELTALHKSGNSTVVLGKLGRFLSTDMDINSTLAADAPAKSTKAEETANMAVGILFTLLRVIFRI